MSIKHRLSEMSAKEDDDEACAYHRWKTTGNKTVCADCQKEQTPEEVKESGEE